MLGKRAIKLLANYLNNPANKDNVLNQLRELLNDSIASVNKTVVLIAASIFVNEDNLKEAYRVLKDGTNLEQYALNLFIFVSPHLTSSFFVDTPY